MDKYQIKLKRAITEVQKEFYLCPSTVNYNKLTSLLVSYQTYCHTIGELEANLGSKNKSK